MVGSTTLRRIRKKHSKKHIFTGLFTKSILSRYKGMQHQGDINPWSRQKNQPHGFKIA